MCGSGGWARSARAAGGGQGTCEGARLLVARRAEDMYRALEAGLVQMAGVEEGSREELLRRVACAEEGAVVMKVRGWRVMWPARERYLSNIPIFISAAPAEAQELEQGVLSGSPHLVTGNRRPLVRL